MPTNRRRRRRRRRQEITDAERQWAEGHPDPLSLNDGELFFVQADRLREVFELVHGETFEEWRARNPEEGKHGYYNRVLLGPQSPPS